MSQSHWPRVLRRGSAASHLLGLWVGHGYLSVVSVVCCQVEVSSSGSSLIQRGPTDCGVFECDRLASIMRRPWPTGGLLPHEKRINPVDVKNGVFRNITSSNVVSTGKSLPTFRKNTLSPSVN